MATAKEWNKIPPSSQPKKVFKLTLYLTRREATHKHKFIKKINIKSF